nr:HNH endonuclease signature motif containing protein [Crocosphaera watsonii]
MIEVDHIIPKSKGGKDTYNNLQALHRHCHDVKSKNDYLYDLALIMAMNGRTMY